MTREEVLQLAKERLLLPTGIKEGVYADQLVSFFRAAYKLGQEEMRKRAAEYFLNKADYPWGDLPLDVIEEQIRNLPIEGK